MKHNLEDYYHIVEDAISELGVDPEGCRGKGDGQWNLRKGSAKIWLDLWHIERMRRAYFQVMSPVVPVPTSRREEFLMELLEINDRLFGVAFAVFDDWAWLKSIREVDDLDVSEAVAMLRRVGEYADQYDDLLMDKYSIRLKGRHGPEGAEEPGQPGHPSSPPTH